MTSARIIFSIILALFGALLIAVVVQVSAIARLAMVVPKLRPIAAPIYRGSIAVVMFALGAIKSHK